MTVVVIERTYRAPRATERHYAFILRNFRAPETRQAAIALVRDLYDVDARRAFLICRALWLQRAEVYSKAA